LRWLGRRENSKQAADQDNALIDTPEHSDVVEDDDMLADETSATTSAGLSGGTSDS
jgi:hypothetical protein